MPRTTPRACVPAAIFLPPATEPAPVVPAGWWRNGKTLVLAFVAAPAVLAEPEEDH